MFEKHRALRRLTRSRLFRAACLMVATTTVMLSMATGSADASWRNGEMFNYGKQQCMDGGGGYLSSWSCNGSGVQIWTDISPDGVTWYQFRDGIGQCVDAGQYTTGLYSCNGGDWQQFYATYVGNINGRDWYIFKNGHTGLCLDGGSGRFTVCSGNNSNAYQWWSWN